MLTIQLLKPGRDTMDLLSDRNLQSRHQIWRQTPNLVPWEKSRKNVRGVNDSQAFCDL